MAARGESIRRRRRRYGALSLAAKYRTRLTCLTRARINSQTLTPPARIYIVGISIYMYTVACFRRDERMAEFLSGPRGFFVLRSLYCSKIIQIHKRGKYKFQVKTYIQHHRSTKIRKLVAQHRPGRISPKNVTSLICLDSSIHFRFSLPARALDPPEHQQLKVLSICTFSPLSGPSIFLSLPTESTRYIYT